jgi:transposase
MARAYSHDLRVRVLDAVEAGLSRRAAALRYRVGVATVIRWAAHATMTGETRAQRQGRPTGSKLDVHEAFLLALTEEKDDMQIVIGLWQTTYNRLRPHSSLGYRPPAPVTYPDLAFRLPMAATMQ